MILDNIPTCYTDIEEIQEAGRVIQLETDTLRKAYKKLPKRLDPITCDEATLQRYEKMYALPINLYPKDADRRTEVYLRQNLKKVYTLGTLEYELSRLLPYYTISYSPTTFTLRIGVEQKDAYILYLRKSIIRNYIPAHITCEIVATEKDSHNLFVATNLRMAKILYII